MADDMELTPFERHHQKPQLKLEGTTLIIDSGDEAIDRFVVDYEKSYYFEASVKDTSRNLPTVGKPEGRLHCMCECAEVADAEKIAAALNAAHDPRRY